NQTAGGEAEGQAVKGGKQRSAEPRQGCRHRPRQRILIAGVDSDRQGSTGVVSSATLLKPNRGELVECQKCKTQKNRKDRRRKVIVGNKDAEDIRSEEHTSELQSLT